MWSRRRRLARTVANHTVAVRRLGIALAALLSCTAPVTTGSPPPSAIQTTGPSATAPASRSPAAAFSDLAVSAAGDVRAEHALVLSLISSSTAGVPSQARIWDVPLDGSTPRQLVAYTRGPQIFTDYDYFGFPRQLSPDGRQLVLSDPTDIVGSGLIVVDLIAGLARKIAISGGSDQPAWSPDGQRIAYRGFAIAGPFQKESGIWVVPAAGGTPQQVTTSDVAAGAGATSVYGWTHDGTGLVFSLGSANASVVEIATGKITRLGAVQGIAWRAKRPSVALVFDEQEQRPNAPFVGRVEVRDTTLSPPKTVARYGPSEGTFFIAAAWHPRSDELLLLYACGQGVNCRNEIVIVDGVAATRRVLPTAVEPRSAAWSADGARITYGDLPAIRVMNADGSNDRELFRPATPAGASLHFVTAMTAFAPR